MSTNNSKRKWGEDMDGSKNPYSERATCKHCGKEIGHRPYTRGWEHVKFTRTCEKPFPKLGDCFCEVCLPQ